MPAPLERVGPWNSATPGFASFDFEWLRKPACRTTAQVSNGVFKRRMAEQGTESETPGCTATEYMQRCVAVGARQRVPRSSLGLADVHIAKPDQGVRRMQVKPLVDVVAEAGGQSPGFSHGVIDRTVFVVHRRTVVA
ncbi:hypothetical protein D3C80_1480770 [compost metagenome]